MKKVLLFALILVYGTISIHAQFGRLSRTDSLRIDSLNKITQEDYRNMLNQMGIASVRPGPSGNPQAQNAANTDEAKASPYTSLPDPLILNNGKKVTNAKTWYTNRRAEIVELFDREVYGRTPSNTPKVTWEVAGIIKELVGNVPAITKRLIGHVDNSAFPQIA